MDVSVHSHSAQQGSNDVNAMRQYMYSYVLDGEINGCLVRF